MIRRPASALFRCRVQTGALPRRPVGSAGVVEPGCVHCPERCAPRCSYLTLMYPSTHTREGRKVYLALSHATGGGATWQRAFLA